MQRRRFLERSLQAALAASAAPAGATTQSDPADELATWHDARRARDLPLRVRWPVGSGECALIVHSHGLGGSRDGGEAWGRAWQQAGFAVLHLQHPGSDIEVLRSGLGALGGAASAEQLRARVADVRFALDELTRRHGAGQSGWSRVRLDALGLSGHSFGAHTVQALAGQRFPIAAEPLADARLKAFVALSPSLGARLSATEQFGAVRRPFLAVTGSDDGDPLGSDKTGADRARVYDGLPAGARALLWLDGADHATFGGGNGLQRQGVRRQALRRAPTAVEREPRHRQLVAALTTLWWRARLLGDAQAIEALRAPAGLADGDRWQQG